LEAVPVTPLTVPLTVSVTFLVVSLTVSDALVPEDFDEVSLLAVASGVAEADGVGLGVVLEPPVKMLPRASPMVPSRPPSWLALADGVGVGVSLVPEPEPLDVPFDPEDDVLDVPFSPEPESDEEDEPEEPEVAFCVEGVAGAAGLAEPLLLSLVSFAESLPLAEADGEGEAEALFLEPSSAVTQSLYSFAVRLLAGDADELLLSARASEDVTPSPMKTAVGIATVAIALPAGMCNLVNSGFFGAAWRGPVLARDSSTSVPWVTSSAGTVPPVRPVGRARS
jgi:hypothetical protein